MVSVIGKTVVEAERLLKEEGMRLRVEREDGERFVTTCDYCADRVNVSVVNGLIDEVLGVG